MKTFNARVAIYCDVEIEAPDSFDIDNYESEELDALIEQAFDKAPELYDPKIGRTVEAEGYELFSIWDEVKNVVIYEGY